MILQLLNLLEELKKILNAILRLFSTYPPLARTSSSMPERHSDKSGC